MAHDVDGIWELVQSNGFGVRVDIAQARDASGLADVDYRAMRACRIFAALLIQTSAPH